MDKGPKGHETRNRKTKKSSKTTGSSKGLKSQTGAVESSRRALLRAPCWYRSVGSHPQKSAEPIFPHMIMMEKSSDILLFQMKS